MKSLTIGQKYGMSSTCALGYMFVPVWIPLLLMAISGNPSAIIAFVSIVALSLAGITYFEWSRRKYAVEFAKIKVQDAYEKYIAALRHEKKLLEGRAEYLENLEQFLHGVTP